MLYRGARVPKAFDRDMYSISKGIPISMMLSQSRRVLRLAFHVVYESIVVDAL